MNRRKWLARFGASFVIIGVVLMYETYQALSGRLVVAPWQTVMYAAGSACALALGMLGVRERHRRDDGD